MPDQLGEQLVGSSRQFTPGLDRVQGIKTRRRNRRNAGAGVAAVALLVLGVGVVNRLGDSGSATQEIEFATSVPEPTGEPIPNPTEVPTQDPVEQPTPDPGVQPTTRASAGLIVSEGVYPSVNGKGYCRTPGLVTDTQVAGWRQVTDAVHAEGGAMVAQIMHCGRVAHADNKPADAETIAPSAITATGDMYTDTAGMQPFDDPREMTADEIIGAIDEHARATSRALEAGFDGVELHGTSGYLSAQFLSTGTNQRSDERRQHRTPVLRTISTCPPEIEPITETAEELLALLTHADTDLLPLLPALAYALGDLSLLVDDLRPDPAKVMEEQAGWTAEQQERCVAIALPALERVRSGEAASEPNLEDLHQIMAWTCGVDLSGSYVTMLAEELAPNNADLRAPDWSKMDVAPDRPFKVAIVGAGMSGILAAHRMQQAGVDYVLYAEARLAAVSLQPGRLAEVLQRLRRRVGHPQERAVRRGGHRHGVGRGHQSLGDRDHQREW
ncbi:N-ethylmaleimide reductase [Nymphon striatum]|nr:N-ethylmaleimide reductase [Nymphon striatum]